MACGAHSPVAVAHQRAHRTVSPVRMHKTKEPKSPGTSEAFLFPSQFPPLPFETLNLPVTLRTGPGVAKGDFLAK
jgi:hypothetical protein